MALLRAEGRYGPRLREVLPALVGLVVTVCVLVAGLALLHRALGGRGLLLGLVPLAAAGMLARRRARRLARRRRGLYSRQELAELDTRGLMLAVSRMLRRDGWRVAPPASWGRPQLDARDARGRSLHVAFRPVAEPLPDEDTPLPRPRGSGGAARPHVRLVVHRGAFTHRDHLWARHQDDLHLIDGDRLGRWARGTPLAEVDATAALPPGRAAEPG